MATLKSPAGARAAEKSEQAANKAKALGSKSRRMSSDGFMPKQPIAYGYGYKDPMRKNDKGELIGGIRYRYPIHDKAELANHKKNGWEHHLAGEKDPGSKDYSKQKAEAQRIEADLHDAYKKKHGIKD